MCVCVCVCVCMCAGVVCIYVRMCVRVYVRDVCVLLVDETVLCVLTGTPTRWSCTNMGRNCMKD